MKKILVITLFMQATLAWAAAQQPDSTPEQSSGQATSPSSQAPDASPSQPSTPNKAAKPPVTEGCLGGSALNFTIKDKAGTTYKLNMPPNADTSTLAQHVGESVQVAGDRNDTNKANASINVQGIGRGTGTCPSSGAKGTQAPPKQ
jgi:hypothetical protein